MGKRLEINDLAPELNLQSVRGEFVSLTDFSGKPTAVIFMRYVGCPVCQMETIAYKQQYETLRDTGLEVLMVFQSSVENLQRYAVQEALPFTTLSDPKGSAYKAWGAEWGIGGFISPKNLSPIVKSLKAGHRHGKFEGNEFQYPAAFIVDTEGRIRFCHYGKTVSDAITPQQLLQAFRNLNVAEAINDQ